MTNNNSDEAPAYTGWPVVLTDGSRPTPGSLSRGAFGPRKALEEHGLG
jgi:hypothetical protein